MKADFLIKQVLNKVNVPNKSELEEAISKLPNLDIPDDFEAVVQSFASLHTEDSAKSHKGLAEYHTNKYKDNFSKAMTAKIQASGFNESEIDEVLKQPFEDRWESIMKIALEKERGKFSLSESEKVKLAEDRAAREKERADRLQQANIEKEFSYKRQMEEQLMEYDLYNFVAGMPINDNIPKDEAIKLIVDKAKARMQAANAKLTRSGSQLRIVQADDTALDFYDEKNNPVYLQAFVEDTMASLNLLRKREAPKPAPGGLRQAFLNNEASKPTGPQSLISSQIRSILNSR